MKHVSIIIVNYNALQMTRDCISSIVKETKFLDYEIIIVDNGSVVDNYDEILVLFPFVKVIRNKANLGFAAANNRALSDIKGKYILFLNNDTLFIEDSLSKIFNYAEQFNFPLFLSCQLLNEDKSNQETVVEFPSVWNGFTENFFLYKVFPKSEIFNKYYQNNHTYTEPIEVDVIRGAFMFCTAKAIKDLGGFDERFFFYSEETDLCYRFKKSGGKIILFPGTSIIHLGGITTDKNLWFKFKNQTLGKILFYQKHFKGIHFIEALIIHFAGLLLRGVLFTVFGLLMLRKNLLVKGYYFFRQLTVFPKNIFKPTES